MNHFEIILSALALAFTCIHGLMLHYRIKGMNIKPFNCMMCLTGWFSFILALLQDYTFAAVLFAAVGVLVGGMFDRIQSKYL